MISGIVTPNAEAVITLRVRGPGGQEEEIEAVIDTGFDGWLSLCPGLVVTLGLPWRRRGRALLADGSESIFDIYEAIVIWDGEPRRIAVDEADTDPLVGMALMNGYAVGIQVVNGGMVTLEVMI
ncbi:MAG: clan AA aspartic protease [Chloroflexi bacterium]|nr:clan AA aspartic protease [Chloroflexota bacterium]